MRSAPRLAALLCVLALGGALGACGGDDEADDPAPQGSEPQAADTCSEVAAPEPKEVELDRPDRVLQRGAEATATVQTNCGSFAIDLDTRRSPRTTNSFAYLAEEGVYGETPFHRIVPGFVIQGGDPMGTGLGGPGYSVDEPPPEETAYLKGMVAMAKSADEPPGRSGSQFFVVTAPADANLPPEYAVLGEVSDGLEVVERIAELGDPETEEPLETVVIESVTIERG